MALITTIADLKKYVVIDGNMRIDTLRPFIEEAERLYIRPLLGQAFYDEFVDNYVALPLTPDNETLLPFIQRPLAYYAMYHSLQQVSVTIGDQGVRQMMGPNAAPAAKWQVRDLQLSYINQADRFADELLQYLEENASLVKYENWFNDSEANTAMSGCIVYKTSIASKYIDINDSRRVFLRLKKRIRDIEANLIKSLVCSDQYEELTTQLKTGSLTPANAKLLPLMEPLIAKKALYLTLPSISVSISPDGIHLLSSSDSIVSQQQADEKRITALMKSLRDDEFGYLHDEDTLRKFITDNIADYPLIETSPCYSQTPTARKYVADNHPLNKHFSV